MLDDRRTGLPDVDPLIEVHEAAERALQDTMAVGAAESVVAGVRQTELAAEQQAACRGLAAARGLLTRACRACRDGSAARIAAAAGRVEAAQTEFDNVFDRVIAEMQLLVRVRSEHLDQMFEHIDRSWAAGDAVMDALGRARPGPAGRPDTETGGGAR